MKPFEELQEYAMNLGTPQDVLEHLTPIQYAAKYGNLAFLEEHLATQDETEKEALLALKNKGGGLTALHLAAFYGQVEVVNLLLNLGACVDSLSQLQRLPIQSAFSHLNSKTTIMKLFHLLNKEARLLLHADFNGDTVAHLSALLDIPEILNTLQRSHEALFLKKNNQSRTPLLVAICHQSKTSLPLLLNNKAITIKDCKERNALHYATLFGTTDCISIVLPHFDINAPDGEGSTAIEFAMTLHDATKIKLLQEAGAHIRVQRGYT